jgi:hypothetical protein
MGDAAMRNRMHAFLYIQIRLPQSCKSNLQQNNTETPWKAYSPRVVLFVACHFLLCIPGSHRRQSTQPPPPHPPGLTAAVSDMRDPLLVQMSFNCANIIIFFFFFSFSKENANISGLCVCVCSVEQRTDTTVATLGCFGYYWFLNQGRKVCSDGSELRLQFPCLLPPTSWVALYTSRFEISTLGRVFHLLSFSSPFVSVMAWHDFASCTP